MLFVHIRRVGHMIAISAVLNTEDSKRFSICSNELMIFPGIVLVLWQQVYFLICMYIYTCEYTYVATLVEYKKMMHVPSYISHPLIISHNYLTTRYPLPWYSVLDIVPQTALNVLYGPLLGPLPLNSMDIR